MKCRVLKLLLILCLGLNTLFAQDITLSRGTPEEVGMDETILKEETVKLMTSPQTASLYTPEERENRDSYYGYGWSVNRDGVFFHTGSDGTAAWVDPNNGLIVLVFTQSPGATSIRVVS